MESRWDCKAAEGRRSPKRKRLPVICELRDSVLECASPLALSSGQKMLKRDEVRAAKGRLKSRK